MIYNLGSINADLVYSVPSLPRPGETLAATEVMHDLGGKGANMSIAAALAGGHVRHIGAVGEDGIWTIEALRRAGVEPSVAVLPECATGQAVIMRETTGENAIVTLAGANAALDPAFVLPCLAEICADDVFVFQNETNLGPMTAKIASEAGAHVLYAAAPFCAEAVQQVLAYVDTLVLNSVEMAQLQETLGLTPTELGSEQVVVTQGANGASVFRAGQDIVALPAPRVDVVDTTGAGDTLTGYLAAGLDAGRPFLEALERAILAASLMTTKKGTASAIPSQNDVERFRFRSR